MKDPRRPEWVAEDHKRANEFATRGSVKHFLLRLGFMPDNEEVAEAILERIVREREYYEEIVERNCPEFLINK